MRTETLEKVLEKLAVTDKTTLAIEKAPEGKIRCDVKRLGQREGDFEGRGARGAQCRRALQVVRKERRPDEWDPPIEPYDPYGPGEPAVVVTDEVSTEL
jgi:hypothetical protein